MNVVNRATQLNNPQIHTYTLGIKGGYTPEIFRFRT